MIRAEVSAVALRGNLARIREIVRGARVMAVVKANAYGHGLVSTALCLADADTFAVARLEEALALRSAGVRKPIVLLEGVLNAEQLDAAAGQNLEIVVHEPEQLSLLQEFSGRHRFAVWLKIDSGMNRLGFRSEQVETALAALSAMGERLQDLRLMTHFASADEHDSPFTALQFARFTELTRGYNRPRSLANSAAVFAHPATHGDWVRPGLALYGVSPFAHEVGSALGLTAAMRLISTVIAVRQVPAGETVGYGATWCAGRDSRIAIIAAGYGDGLPRSLPNGTPVLINGQRAPLAGRVSMDMIALDVTDIAPVQVGDEALLWGPELPVEEVAAHAGTISYELLCGMSQRVPVAPV